MVFTDGCRVFFCKFFAKCLLGVHEFVNKSRLASQFDFIGTVFNRYGCSFSVVLIMLPSCEYFECFYVSFEQNFFQPIFRLGRLNGIFIEFYKEVIKKVNINKIWFMNLRYKCNISPFQYHPMDFSILIWN